MQTGLWCWSAGQQQFKYSQLAQSSLYFADKAQFGSSSSRCAQSRAVVAHSHSLCDKKKASVSVLLQKPTDGWPPRCQQSISAVLKHGIPVSDSWTRWWKKMNEFSFLSRPQLFGDNRNCEVDFIWSLHITKGVLLWMGWHLLWEPSGEVACRINYYSLLNCDQPAKEDKRVGFPKHFSLLQLSTCNTLCWSLHMQTTFLTGPHSASVEAEIHVIFCANTVMKSNQHVIDMLNYIN